MAHKNKTNVSPFKKTASGTSHKKPTAIHSFQEANDRLFDIFKNHGFSHITHDQRMKLAKYYVMLMEQQKTLNLTRIVNLREVAVKHFIDCLIIPQLYQLKFPLMDVGSGPGFPGIPLKILFPNEPIFLAEGVQKRVDFLKSVRDELELPNLGIFGRNINPFFMYPVQGVITRAVEDVRNTLVNVRSCLQLNGEVYFMKGPQVDPEIDLAKKEVGDDFKLIKDIKYDLPLTENHRRLVIYKKTKLTPLPDLDSEPWPEDD